MARPVGIHVGGPAVRRKRIQNTLLIGIPFVGALLSFPYVLHFGVSWLEVAVALASYVFVGLGATLGLHRLFTHKSYEAHPVLRFLLGAAGTMAFQGSILRWVADHRRHHAQTETVGDLHSPHIDPFDNQLSGWRGFWHAHVGWMFDNTATDVQVYGRDLLEDPLIMFFERTHWWWLALSLGGPFAIGYLFGGLQAAIGCLLIGGCLRTAVLHQATWAVNSICHSHGDKPYEQHNESRNNRAVAVLTFGEGWHNNHHRFPRSAFQGFEPGEWDISARVLLLLERFGLVKDLIDNRPARLMKGAGAALVGGEGEGRQAGVKAAFSPRSQERRASGMASGE